MLFRSFAELGYLVGISIDGPPDLHDAYRVDPAGRGTFDRVVRGLDRLKAHGIEWNVLTSVHAANGDHGGAVYRFLRDELGARYIQLIPVVERIGPDGRTGNQAGDRVTDRSVRPDQWGRFLVEVFDEWVQGDVGEVFVVNFDWSLAAWVGIESPVCIFRETCGDALALETLRSRDAIRTIPLLDYVAATSVGIVGGEPLLDLAYEDDSRADVDMNVVMTGAGRFVEVQGTAEAIPFGRDALNTLLDLAHHGIGQLIEKQRAIVGHLVPPPATGFNSPRF